MKWGFGIDVVSSNGLYGNVCVCVWAAKAFIYRNGAEKRIFLFLGFYFFSHTVKSRKRKKGNGKLSSNFVLLYFQQ